jgi:hypothetical protein
MLDSVRLTLTENAIVGLFCIQRYPLLGSNGEILGAKG